MTRTGQYAATLTGGVASPARGRGAERPNQIPSRVGRRGHVGRDGRSDGLGLHGFFRSGIFDKALLVKTVFVKRERGTRSVVASLLRGRGGNQRWSLALANSLG